MIFLIIITVQGVEISIAHSGGTNSSGCHAGSKPYHCHGGPDNYNKGGGIIIIMAVVGTAHDHIF